MAKSKLPEPEFVDFDFQKMPLAEAMRLCAAGGGKYEAVAARLIEQIPAMMNQSKPETLAFGLPGGKELEESARRGVSTALSSRLKKAGLPFKVTYSSSRKIFLVVPGKNYNPPSSATVRDPVVPRASVREKRSINSAKVLDRLVPIAGKLFGENGYMSRDGRKALAKVAVKRLGVRKGDIAPHLRIGKAAVKYLCSSRGAEAETEKLYREYSRGGG